MTKFLLPMLLLFVGIVSAGVRAQEIYRCGNTYSQAPCPGGVAVQVRDTRTVVQQSQARKATARDMKIAEELKQAPAQADTPAASSAKIARSSSEGKHANASHTSKPQTVRASSGKQKDAGEEHPDVVAVAKAKRKPPPPFTAHVPAPKKEKKKRTYQSVAG